MTDVIKVNVHETETVKVYEGGAGPTGPQGEPGPAGPASTVPGPQGERGPAGRDGTGGQDSTVPGPRGLPGADSTVPGPRGPAGEDGKDGADSTVPGPQGERGERGPVGAASTVPDPQGERGEIGPKGDRGDTGAASTVPGPQGPVGPASTVPGPQDPAGNSSVSVSEHERRGVGMPNGRETAPVGTYYTDTAATNGAIRWVKSTGTGNTGWTVSHEDTGWRRIPTPAGFNAAYGFINIRRINDEVTFLVSDVWPLAAGEIMILAGGIAGFRPTGRASAQVWREGSAIANSLVGWKSSGLFYQSAGANSWTYGTVTALTTEA